ncbi:MAG: hypothetical protein SPH62_00965 [Candidatus Egerieousia sp.]|nr:hypothetical protein [bacterium]MDY5254970.1 hypothetical protein [Candidatus Egerieousia sp.]
MAECPGSSLAAAQGGSGRMSGQQLGGSSLVAADWRQQLGGSGRMAGQQLGGGGASGRNHWQSK